MSTTAKNIFGFASEQTEKSSFERTATFFHPAESIDGSSYSTQVTEDSKDASLPNTPEKRERLGKNSKILKIKKVNSIG